VNGALHILVVDDEPDIALLVRDILEDEGFTVSVARDATQAREARRARRPDLVLLDIWLPDTDGITLLEEWARQSHLDTPVVMMSGHGTIETAVEATRLGAYDYIEKPLSTPKLLLSVHRALETAKLRRENVGLRRDSDLPTEPIGRSRLMEDLRQQLRRVAQHDAPVLISGESGCGKAICAHYLHAVSNRRSGPFVRMPADAGGKHDSAVVLFGSEEGGELVFGCLEQANGGTFFLPNLLDIDSAVQTRLLGALRQGSFLRVGGREPVHFNARMVAATNRDPGSALAAGEFRDDLYYHLNVVPLRVPPLREHREDVPELLAYYMDSFASRESLTYRRFTVGAQNRLRNHEWPGNVLELKNLVHRLLILGSGADIDQAEVEAALGVAPGHAEEIRAEGVDLPLKTAREQFEREYLLHQIDALGGNISKVAEKAGLERTHLYRKLKSLGIDPKRSGSRR